MMVEILGHELIPQKDSADAKDKDGNTYEYLASIRGGPGDLQAVAEMVERRGDCGFRAPGRHAERGLLIQSNQKTHFPAGVRADSGPPPVEAPWPLAGATAAKPPPRLAFVWPPAGLLACILLFLGWAVGGCGRYLLYVDLFHPGRVVDAATGEPIAGAVVSVKYVGATPTPAGDVHFDIGFRERLTDESGRFLIPPMISARPFPISYFERTDLTVFKPGYRIVRMDAPWLPLPEKLSIRMQPIKTLGEARKNLEFLPSVYRGDWPVFWGLVDEEECRVEWDCGLRRQRDEEEDRKEAQEQQGQGKSGRIRGRERGTADVARGPSVRAEPAREIAGIGSRPGEANRISVAGLDVRVFEDDPAGAQDLMGVLAETLDLHDVWGLLLEGRDSAGFLEKMAAAWNGDENRFVRVPGPTRVADGVEMTPVFLYRPSAVELARSVTIEDTDGRAAPAGPFCGFFQARGGGFDFTLVILHTRPGLASEEGVRVGRWIDRAVEEFREQDVIVLGTCDVDRAEFKAKDVLPSYPKSDRLVWMISRGAARRGEVGTGDLPVTYSRSVLPRSTLKEDYVGAGHGAPALERLWRTDGEAAGKISMNRPVWLEFRIDRDSD